MDHYLRLAEQIGFGVLLVVLVVGFVYNALYGNDEGP